MTYYPLFAKARDTDPITSHAAADTMNEIRALRFQHIAVLEALKDNEGLSAKQLGIFMAKRYTGLSSEAIEQVVRLAGIPHRRLEELRDRGLVERIIEDGAKHAIWRLK